MDPPTEGLVPPKEGSGVSIPGGFEGPRALGCKPLKPRNPEPTLTPDTRLAAGLTVSYRFHKNDFRSSQRNPPQFPGKSPEEKLRPPKPGILPNTTT